MQSKSFEISTKEVNGSLKGKIEGRGRDFSSWIILRSLARLAYRKEWSYAVWS